MDTVATAREEPARRYDPPHILWYFGALAAALSASATVGSVGAGARGTYQLLVGLVFAAAFGLGAALLLRSGWRVPGSVLATATVLMVPATGQAFERLIGVWPSLRDDRLGIVQDFEGAFFTLALATVAAGLVAFALVRFPFLFATVTVGVVLAALLLVPALVDDPSFDDRATCLALTGAVLVLVGFVLDSVGHRPDAFWWHATGLGSLGLGLAWYAFVRHEGWAWLTVLVIAAVLILASAPFGRATWATYGVVGVFAAILHYDGDLLGSWKEPALMVVVSVGLLLLGIVLQRYGGDWASRLRRPAPARVAEAPPGEGPPPEQPA